MEKKCDSFKVSGSHEAVGKQIGKHFKSAIHELIDKVYSNELSWLHGFSEQPHIKEIVSEFLYQSKQVYPQYVEELEATADGADVPFNKLFLLHLEPELTALWTAANENRSLGTPLSACTTLCLNTEEDKVLLHNEDISPSFCSSGYMLDVEIPRSQNVAEEVYTAYTSPGMLPGNTISMNHHGLTYCLNMLCSLNTSSKGNVPRRFINRALLSAKSIDEVKVILQNGNYGHPFHLTLSEVSEDGSRRFVSLETAPTDVVKVVETELQTNITYHVNNFKYHSNKDAQMKDRSSDSRETTIDLLIERYGHEADRKKVIDIISDETNPEYPVYRSGATPDYLATAITCMFDYKSRSLQIYTKKPSCNLPIWSRDLY